MERERARRPASIEADLFGARVRTRNGSRRAEADRFQAVLAQQALQRGTQHPGLVCGRGDVAGVVLEQRSKVGPFKRIHNIAFGIPISRSLI